MDRPGFRDVIDEAQRAGADDSQRVAALVDVLATRGVQEIKGFAQVQADLMVESYSWPLWGRRVHHQLRLL